MTEFFAENRAIRFFDDAVRVLRKADKKIRKSLINGREAQFYSTAWKGLGLYTTTEPILKYIIYTGLCHKYKMWSEYKYNDNTKLLDLGIRICGKNDAHDMFHPDAAVEMKIAKIKNDMKFSQSAVERFAHDLIKLQNNSIDIDQHDGHDIHKFFMQFIFFENDIYLRQLKKDVKKRLKDHIKNPKIKLFYVNSFKTLTNKNKWSRFWVLVWKVR